MAGTELKPDPPLARCGCGGRGILWENSIPFTGRASVEAFCSKHCGIRVSPLVVRAGTTKKVARIWNRAMSGKAR